MNDWPDWLSIAFASGALAFFGYVITGLVLSKIIGLTLMPKERALKTALVAGLATLTAVFFLPSEMALDYLIASVLMYFVAYYYLLAEYNARWIDDDAVLPEDVKLANKSWLVGLGGVVLFVVVRGIRAYFVQTAVGP